MWILVFVADYCNFVSYKFIKHYYQVTVSFVPWGGGGILWMKPGVILMNSVLYLLNMFVDDYWFMSLYPLVFILVVSIVA
jgi:hypothetical protein